MRRLLTEGAEVTVIHLAARESGVVERVGEGGRLVVVVTQSDSVLEFHLMASAHYVTQDRCARLGV